MHNPYLKMKILFKLLSDWFYRILSFGRIDKNNIQEKNPNYSMRNRDIYDNLIALFENGIENESVGERMLFPMSFYILMNINDYEDRKKALPVLVQESVKVFYDIIRKKKDVFPNSEPISKKWVFQFSPCQIDSSIETEDLDVISVTKGNIVSTASLYNDAIDTFEDVQIDRNIKVSIKCNNSNVIKTANLNLRALAGVDILGEGFFAIPFDFDDKSYNNFEKKSVELSQPTISKELEVIIENAPLAELSYVLKNTDTAKYTMRATPIIISGKKDPRTLSNIFKLDYNNIENGHVQIKYENKEFSLCAFGETRLNEKSVELSKPGDITWIPLADNSDILMNGEIQLKFKKL